MTSRHLNSSWGQQFPSGSRHPGQMKSRGLNPHFRDAQILHLHKETARPEHHRWDVFGKGRGDIISLA